MVSIYVITYKHLRVLGVEWKEKTTKKNIKKDDEAKLDVKSRCKPEALQASFHTEIKKKTVSNCFLDEGIDFSAGVSDSPHR